MNKCIIESAILPSSIKSPYNSNFVKNLLLTLVAVFAFQIHSFGQQEAKTSDGRKIILL